MTRAARVALAGTLLGLLLLEGPNNPFVFVPDYIDLLPFLEMLCCVVVGIAVCYAAATIWERDELNGPNGKRVLKAILATCACGLGAYYACCFFAVALHYFAGFGNAVATAYAFVVTSSIIAIEVGLKRLSSRRGQNSTR